MNHLVATNTFDPSLNEALAHEFATSSEDDIAAQRAQNLIASLRNRWWYYLLITALAAGAAYYVATEFGNYKYRADATIRVTDLPYPPGDKYLQPPGIGGFHLYLSHPEVLAQLRDEFGVELPGPDDPPLVEDALDKKTQVLTVSATRGSAEEAAELVNNLITTAVSKSTEERTDYLNRSLVFYNRLINEAEAEAASKRQAKVDRIEAMRAQFSIDPDAELEFEEISQIIGGQRDRLTQLQLELKDADRLELFLRADEKAVISQIMRELPEDYKDELKTAAKPFTPTSPQAMDIANRIKQLDEIASRDIENTDQLKAAIRDMGQILDTEVTIPDDYLSRINGIRDQLIELTNRRRILPQAIEDAKQSLANSLDERAGMEITKLLDFENSPELVELTAQIERADRKVDQLTSAIDWVKGMLALDQPAFEPLTSASAETAVPDGNHLKLAVATFGLVGLLLGMPVLIRDTFHSDVTPSGRLGQEFGLPTMSAQEIQGRSFKKAGLQSHDPELRLLANRIQQSARDARGSVVLFSSLSDDVSTDELTRTIAGCLAAREEKVLVIDLETIDQNRNGKQKKRLPSKKGEEITDDRPQEAGLSERKVGLAMALSGATKDVDDVLIHHDESGIDRLQLGSGELPVEAFASPMMSRLLDRYRNQYSLVLLSGPPAKYLADLQVLSAKCDGTMFVAPDRGEMPASARRTVMDLMKNHVPVMGIVEVPS